jgi:squalene-hopene/tetraprenyl-beta-curcumene cyclase
MIKALGFTAQDRKIRKLAALLKRTQNGQPRGSIWFTNYIFGTAAVNRFLALAGDNMTAPEYRQANAWINGLQHLDGGWGESPESFSVGGYVDFPQSSPLITSAVVSSKIDQLLAGGCADYATEYPVIKKGIEFLLAAQNADGYWSEPTFVNSYIPKEKLHCNYGLSTKLAPYEGLLDGLRFLNSLTADENL